MALIDLATAKTFLGLSTDAEDSLIALLCDQVDSHVKNELQRDIERVVYPGGAINGTGDSGYYDGDGSRFIRPKQYPILEGTVSAWLDYTGRFGKNPDGSFATATQLVEGTDFVLVTDGCLPGTTTKCSYSGLIERVNGVWPRLRRFTPGQISPNAGSLLGCIKLVYSAGFSTVPPDLQLACCEILAYVRRNRKKGGPIQSEGLGAYHYAMAGVSDAPELGSARRVLARYRRVAL
jgi:hypothetical protein